jgi:hypothetical protein
MAPVVVPMLTGVGAASVATAVGASAVASTIVGVGTAAVTASMMNQPGSQAMAAPEVPVVDTAETDTTPVDTSSATGGPDTTINDVVSVQQDVASQADTTVDSTRSTPGASSGTAAGGREEAAAAASVSRGPAEDEAIGFYERGRRSTILTSSQGLLSGVDSSLRGRRSLVGEGLIA